MNLKDFQRITVEDIIEFRDHGSMHDVPEEMVAYLQEMEKVRGMHLRFDKYGSRDAIINHLIKFDGYSHYLAAKLHDDAMEYFYLDRGISKQAWRNILAEKMDKAINTALVLAKDSNEIIRAVKEMGTLAKVLGLDQPDKDSVPQELLDKPIKLYTMKAEELGMPKIDRYELGRFIDELPDLTEGQREKAKRDAMLKPIKAFRE